VQHIKNHLANISFLQAEYIYEGTKNLNKTETMFAKDWFLLNNAEDRNRKFKEYCVYYEAMEQVISVLWE